MIIIVETWEWGEGATWDRSGSPICIETKIFVHLKG